MNCSFVQRGPFRSSVGQGPQESTNKVRHPAGEEEEHGEKQDVVHSGHPAGHERGGGGGCWGHCMPNGEQYSQVTAQEHQQGQHKAHDRFRDEQPHVKLPTLQALQGPVDVLQDGSVEVRGRQDGGHQPQDAAGQRHGPVGASQSSPHGPQQAQASLQGHGAEEESGGVQPQTSQKHDQVAEDASERPAVVVSDVAQHQGGAQEQHQVGQGQVQDINTEAAGSTCLLAAASAHQVATMLHSESPNHQPIQRNTHLEEPRGPVQDD